MENKDIKQRVRDMFDERFGELWSGMKIIGGKDQQKEPLVVIDRSGVKYFIDQIIDIAITEERERILDMIYKLEIHHFSGMDRVVDGDDLVKLDEVTNIITNTK